MNIFLRFYYKIRFLRLKGKFQFFGNNANVFGDVQVINPHYISIGEHCKFGSGCRIEAWDRFGNQQFSPQIKFGYDVRINSKCHIGAINSVEIGDECLLGSNVMIIDHAHGNSSADEIDIHPSNRALYSKGKIIIGTRCWICENAVILPGVTIGDSCIIGANAVVTKDIPPYSVAVGNPARVVKKIQDGAEQ